MELTIRIVDKLKTLIESQGRKLTVAFIPYKVHVVENISHNHPMVSLFADMLWKKKIEYLEPFFIFSQLDVKKAGLFNKGDNHFSPQGHALFVRTLLEPELMEQTRNYYHKSSPDS